MSVIDVKGHGEARDRAWLQEQVQYAGTSTSHGAAVDAGDALLRVRCQINSYALLEQKSSSIRTKHKKRGASDGFAIHYTTVTA